MSFTRTFVVRVGGLPRRIVVEDVRERRRTIVTDLSDVGPQIERWLTAAALREDSVSGPAYRRDDDIER